MSIRNLTSFTFFTSLGFLIFMVLIPLKIIGGMPTIQLTNMFEIVGFLFILLGLTLFILTTRTFFTITQATPLISQNPKSLMRVGPYKYSRNPMYIGHMLVFFGETIYTSSIDMLVYTIIFFLSLHLLITLYEEPLTYERLGGKYSQYLHDVPRWL